MIGFNSRVRLHPESSLADRADLEGFDLEETGTVTSLEEGPRLEGPPTVYAWISWDLGGESRHPLWDLLETA